MFCGNSGTKKATDVDKPRQEGQGCKRERVKKKKKASVPCGVARREAEGARGTKLRKAKLFGSKRQGLNKELLAQLLELKIELA